MLLRLAMFIGFALIIVGVFLTWSDNPPFSENGIERTSGLFAFIAAGGAAIIALLDRRPRGAIIAISASALVLIAAVVDLLDISSGTGSPGQGLYVALAGAVLATVASGLLTFSLFKKPTG
ncbi:MAG: hypothetical protein AB7P12_17930 [Alphaproteobacteria bacterium]